MVPQVPAGQTEVFGRRIRVGAGSIGVHAERNGECYVTEVARRGAVGLTIGAVVPRGSSLGVVRFNGRVITPRVVQTTRGTEVRYRVAAGQLDARLVVNLR